MCGVIKFNENYDEDDIENKNITNVFLNEQQNKIFMDNKFIKNLEIDLINNEKYKINDSLIIEDIKFSNKNLKDFGLILYNLNIFDVKIVGIEKICNELYNIWNEISKKIGIKEKDTSINFPLFINSLIQRRNILFFSKKI